MKKILTTIETIPQEEAKTIKPVLRAWIPVIIIIAGFFFAFAGFYRGEMAVVLRKAINICLECIGIG